MKITDCERGDGKNEICETILDHFAGICGWRGATCFDPASDTGECLWFGIDVGCIVDRRY